MHRERLRSGLRAWKLPSSVRLSLQDAVFDPQLTHWIIVNLLSNAIKFSPSGGKNA